MPARSHTAHTGPLSRLMTRPRAIAPALPLALATCVLASCGSGTATLDTKPIAGAIAHSILTQRGITTTVQCPPKVPRKSGHEFTCTARLAVGSYPINVTETNSLGHVRYGSPAPLVILNVAKVQDAIASSIVEQRHLHATVACPAQVLQREGVGFTCQATVAGKQYPFAVTQVNNSGRVRYTGEKASGSS